MGTPAVTSTGWVSQNCCMGVLGPSVSKAGRKLYRAAAHLSWSKYSSKGNFVGSTNLPNTQAHAGGDVCQYHRPGYSRNFTHTANENDMV